MYLEILTPEARLFSGNIKLVQLPGNKGSFEILNKHAPIISSLSAGKIKVIDADGIKNEFMISEGTIQMQDNNIIVLAVKS